MKIKNCVSGFTLVELLVVIAVLGILAGATVVAINPLAKINQAKMANVETFAAGVNNSLAFDLVGEWTFDDGTAKDISGYNNNGTVNGATLTADRKGQANKAYNFNGSSYIDAGNGDSLRITVPPITLSAWIRTNTIAATTYPVGIISKGALGTSGYGINRNGAKINFGYHGSGNFDSNASISTGIWYHIVGTIDPGNNAKIYINGQLDRTGTVGASPTAENLSIGKVSTYYFDGTIDDVRIYKSALLSSQVQQLYAQGLIKHLLALK